MVKWIGVWRKMKRMNGVKGMKMVKKGEED